MSVEYITRLEQGHDRHPSPPALSALADALALTPSERIHLHLAGRRRAEGVPSPAEDGHPHTTACFTVFTAPSRLEHRAS
ncbi:hypothetical protein ACQPXH_08650 [Nocardia sp. CA-135953]|uniref:hypothetical protein n=1 Tax=Nocardia sp. CA-135953 TaxID=3239978 RepID=UPI003D967F23